MMATSKKFDPSGVIPATLLAFDDDYAIDEAASRRHLAHVAATPGVTAITVNAHASEAASCSYDEQRRVLDFTMDEIGARVPVVNGIYADGSHLGAELARMAAAGGASALLVFPPNTLIAGGQLRPEMAVAHFKTIAEAADLPLIVFEYPLGGGQGHTFETLLRLFEEVPSIVAIKDWCNDAMLHEKHIRTFQSLPRPVSVLSTHSSWLMSSLVMGARGLLSGAGSVIADLQVALFEAVQAKDLARAQAVNDRIFPMAQAFYRPPFLDMHNRMKECLVLLGRLPRAVVRPPLVKLPQAEIEALGRALADAGIGPEGAARQAAE